MEKNRLPGINLDAAISLTVALVAFALFFSTLAPTVLEADAGEFQFVPWLPGIAHPPGYPLYTLLGWLWLHVLPFGEVAWRMNLLSALIAAGAIGLLVQVVRLVLNQTLPETPVPAQRIVAVIAALTLAATPTFWSQAIIAEVYALHTLFVVLILWLALQSGERVWAGQLLAVTLGLGLAHHVTTILLVPAVVVYVIIRSGRPVTINVISIIQYGLLAMIPLLLYLYLPIIAPFTPYAQLPLSQTQTLTLYDNSVSGFVDHVSANAFRGDLQPAAVGVERIELVGQLLRRQVGWAGIILAIAGLIVLWRRRKFDLLALTGLALGAVVGFNLIYFIGDVFVLFIPAWLIVCIWLAVGILGLVHWLADRFVRAKIGSEDSVIFHRLRRQLWRNAYQTIMLVLPLFFFALPLLLVAANLSEVRQDETTQVRDRWLEILAEPLPERAVLLSNDRNEIMPMWYYQYVEQRRPDLQGLFPLITPDPAYAHIAGVLDQALLSGRPVYLIKPMDGLSLKADLTPAGTLFQVTPLDLPPRFESRQKLPDVTVALPDGESTESISLVGYDISPASSRAGDTVEITLYWHVDQDLQIDYTSYVHLVAPDGTGLAQSDHRPGGDFYPSSDWQIGETLRDKHTLTLPADLPDGVYPLRAGMYFQPEPGLIVGMGSGVEVGALTVKTPASLG